ncbi:MAG: hypothetical protein D6677_02490 [Calditrichaeota bacterium]|nr:MAG: hypothetical protein D6677_02490 [Calditrichota bacterium]
MRVWAISDLHTDFEENLQWVQQLSLADYRDDVLIVAGDISDDVAILETTLHLLTQRYRQVFFVPGNHDLWIRKDNLNDSLEKFYKVLNLCASLEVNTAPQLLNAVDSALYILPLFSWYVKPEEGNETLYMPKPGENSKTKVWMDDYHIRWPVFSEAGNASEYFLQLNDQYFPVLTPHTVISFSHFLPRRELMRGLYPVYDARGRKLKDPAPYFNFSRFAGSSALDAQLRAAGSSFHIYGHQHRNRYRRIDGVTYFSHGLGYRRERVFAGIDDKAYLPELIWTEANGLLTRPEN